ncbi:MAG: hypothetical protein LBR72_04445 [Oscillospiraceae bacterium]|jgi:uroporphyrinogen decarboxylase|nr:hypothetical protein [Oscillospiraceae bacterium]
MTNRERQHAIFHYEAYDRLPAVHFGWWSETLEKWCAEGHLTREEITECYDGTEKDKTVGGKLGFDYNYYTVTGGLRDLYPYFEGATVREFPDGSKHLRNADGAIVLWKPDANGIPAEIGHTLVDRESWEEHYLPRLRWSDDRVAGRWLDAIKCEDDPLGLHCGSLFGRMRDWMGVEGVSYLLADDEELYDEIVQTLADLQYAVVEKVLASGRKFDFAHFWEDIAFRTGPLINPAVFEEKIGPQYKRFTALCARYGIDIVSVDCDGAPDSLIPTWLNNGVNTMFPIEVGVWDGSFAPWREKYGKALRGVGGMDKRVFARDYAAVDREMERLKPIVELGGYIPCPDHRIPPDAVWENVQYYCERFRRVFGG